MRLRLPEAPRKMAAVHRHHKRLFITEFASIPKIPCHLNDSHSNFKDFARRSRSRTLDHGRTNHRIAVARCRGELGISGVGAKNFSPLPSIRPTPERRPPNRPDTMCHTTNRPGTGNSPMRFPPSPSSSPTARRPQGCPVLSACACTPAGPRPARSPQSRRFPMQSETGAECRPPGSAGSG